MDQFHQRVNELRRWTGRCGEIDQLAGALLSSYVTCIYRILLNTF
jgi:hypothetical protein